MAYLTAGELHLPELQRRAKELQTNIASLKAALDIWQSESWSRKPAEATLKLHRSLVAATTQMLALMIPLKMKSSDDLKEVFWDPIAADQEALRLNMAAALQALVHLHTKSVSRDEAESSLSAAEAATKRIQKKLRQEVAALSTRESGSELVDYAAADATRAFFTHLALWRFVACVRDLKNILAEVDLTGGAKHACGFAPQLTPWRKLVDCKAYFPPSRSDSILQRPTPTLFMRFRRNARHPLRLTVAIHSAVLWLLLIREFDSGPAAKYGFWALLPCIFCFLPTTGAVITKAGRRILGTIVGAGLAILSIWCNKGNGVAFGSQLFIVAGATKYQMARGPLTGYAGGVMGLSWCIVALGSWDTFNEKAWYDAALWRLVMTTAGSVYCILVSVMLFPNHATKLFEQGIADALVCGIEAGVSTLENALEPVQAAQPGEATAEANAEAQEHLAFMLTTLAQTSKQLVKLDAERPFVSRHVSDLPAVQQCTDRVASMAQVLVAEAVAVCDPASAQVKRHLLVGMNALSTELQQSLVQCCKAIRTFAHVAANLIHPARKLGRSRVHDISADSAITLKVARSKVEAAFSAVRGEIIAEGQLPTLLEQGLENCYSLLFVLDEFLAACMELEDKISGPEDCTVVKSNLGDAAKITP